MSGYTKMFTSLLDSSVWGLSKEARLVWLTVLLIKDRDQVVRCSVPGLARRANLAKDDVEKGLSELMAPDPDSQDLRRGMTKYGGRRLVPVDDGWYVVNGEYYRQKMSADERSEYKRVWIARKREEQKRLRMEGKLPNVKHAKNVPSLAERIAGDQSDQSDKPDRADQVNQTNQANRADRTDPGSIVPGGEIIER
jgi:hypothetical protein